MYKRACILVAQGVQDEEFIYPYYRLKEDLDLDVMFVDTEKYNKHEGKYGVPFKPTLSINDVYTSDGRARLAVCGCDVARYFDLFIIPGGWQCPEILRMNPTVLSIIKEAMGLNKVVGAICHGPQVLISAGVCKNRVLTGFAGIHDDLRNAGGYVSNDPVVVDKNLITAQHYKDNSEFMKAVLNTYFNTYVPENYQG